MEMMGGGEAHRAFGAEEKAFCVYPFLWPTLHVPVINYNIFLTVSFCGHMA